MSAEDKELTEEYKELVAAMKEQIEVYVALLSEKNILIQRLQNEISAAGDTLNDRDNKIHNLGDEIDTLKKNIAIAASNAEESSEFAEFSGAEKQDTGTEKLPESLAKQMEEKDKEIERLEMDLRKKNSDLQGLVNKELWEKNREIERMQNRYTTLIETKETEIEALQKDLNGKNLELHLIMDKVLELDFQNRIQFNSSNEVRLQVNEKNINAIIDSIKEDLVSLQSEHQDLLCKFTQSPKEKGLFECGGDFPQQLERSEKLRQETTDICALLTSRLEELALFLDWLLKHKSVLGLLGSEQKLSLRHLVDQSLDLSKNVSLSISLNPDQSLLQLSNISNILNSSKMHDFSMDDLSFEDRNENEKVMLKLEPSNASLVYSNCLTTPKSKSPNAAAANSEEVIFKLRQQIETLKKEVELRDVELENHNFAKSSTDQSEQREQTPKKVSPVKASLNSTSTTLKNAAYDNSESESWSEPDRSVSQARIGLLDESFKGSVSSAASNRSKNRYLSPDKSTESTEEDAAAELLSGSKTSLRRESRYLLSVLQEKISHLENSLKEKDNELLQAQCAYYELDNELKKERIQMEILRQCVSSSEDRLKKVVAEKAKAEEALLQLETAVNESQTSKAELEATVAQSEVKIKELVQENVERVQEMHAMQEETKEKHAQALQKKLQEVDERWTQKLLKIEAEADVRVKEIQEATNELKRAYERDWVRKSDVDKTMFEREVIIRELEGMKSVVKSAEKRMAAMEENEEAAKLKLQESEKCFREKANALRKELDAATLATSEAILERTRIANEKMKLEQELRRFELKETEFLKQMNEFEVEFSAKSHNYKKQLSNLEQQKSHLELRVSELEATNAELLNRLLKVEAESPSPSNDRSGNWRRDGGGRSLPASPNLCAQAPSKSPLASAPLCVYYKRQCSDLSGYTSEEIPLEDVCATGSATWYQNSPLIAPVGVGDVAGLEEEQQQQQPLGRHVVNSSPDLGIESDQGRFSSLEANINSTSRPLLQTLELTQSMTNLLAVTNRSVDVSRASK